MFHLCASAKPKTHLKGNKTNNSERQRETECSQNQNFHKEKRKILKTTGIVLFNITVIVYWVNRGEP